MYHPYVFPWDILCTVLFLGLLLIVKAVEPKNRTEPLNQQNYLLPMRDKRRKTKIKCATQ